MSQPKWKEVANIGDKDPLEGGAILYVDETGVYPPELEICQPWIDGQYEVSRIQCQKHTFKNGVLSCNKYHPDKPEWYADKITCIASNEGISDAQLISMLCSDDPKRRAHGYKHLVDYFGEYEFDHDPLMLSEAEAKERYSDLKLSQTA